MPKPHQNQYSANPWWTVSFTKADYGARPSEPGSSNINVARAIRSFFENAVVLPSYLLLMTYRIPSGRSDAGTTIIVRTRNVHLRKSRKETTVIVLMVLLRRISRNEEENFERLTSLTKWGHHVLRWAARETNNRSRFGQAKSTILC